MARCRLQNRLLDKRAFHCLLEAGSKYKCFISVMQADRFVSGFAGVENRPVNQFIQILAEL
ncbi:hypothetical protein FM107_05665 [Sphingobacterium sp. JB170]|nr:hypothetical protein FM107_05665 [Sphingobacterium sp. JB170]